MKRAAALLVVCAACSGAAKADEITFEQTGDDAFVLTLTSTTQYDIDTSQNLLIAKALELCGELLPTFEKYSFESSEALADGSETTTEPSYRFTQHVTCGAAAEAVAPETAQQSYQFAPPDQIEARARELTEAYFAALTGGQFDVAWAYLTENMQSYKTFAEWEQANKELYLALGAVETRTVWRVTIYDNPPNAPMPGLYVAADYFNAYENAPFHCGYLIWFSDGERAFRILREETGHLTQDIVGQMTGEQLEQVKAQFGCPPP